MSANYNTLLVPPSQKVEGDLSPPVPMVVAAMGRRAFSVAGPTVWNSLPTEFRCLSNSFDDFRRMLKTVLFARY